MVGFERTTRNRQRSGVAGHSRKQRAQFRLPMGVCFGKDRFQLGSSSFVGDSQLIRNCSQLLA